MSITSEGTNRSELIDVIERLSNIQLLIVRRLRGLSRLRRLERLTRRRVGAVAEPGLIRQLEYLEQVIPVRRDELVAAIAAADEQELSLLGSHQLLNDSDDWPVKYAAFIAADSYALDSFETGGAGLSTEARRLKEIKSAMPALQLGNAILGSAVHAIPIAGGVYKEIKDNVEGIVGLVERIPGAVGAAGRAVVKLFTKGKPPEVAVAGGDQPEGGPAPVGMA